LNDVLITKHLVDAALLRGVLAAAAPDIGEPEFSKQVFMELPNGRSDSESVSSHGQDQWVLEIWGPFPGLGVHANETQLIPDLVNKQVDAPFFLHRNAAILVSVNDALKWTPPVLVALIVILGFSRFNRIPVVSSS